MTAEVLPRVAEPSALADDPFLAIISRAAADPNTDVSKLERLVELYERHQATEAKRAYDEALAEVQPLLPITEEHGGITDRSGKVQSTYARWEDIQEDIKPILAAHGFALTFRTADEDAWVVITALLSHRCGHREQTTKRLPLDLSGNKNSVQAHGSSVSYGMRYTAMALLNLTSRGIDDDGQAGGTPLINEGQIEVLRKLLRQSRTGEKRFCEHYQIEAIDRLPAGQFVRAERMLQDRVIKAAPGRQQEVAQEPTP